MRNDPTGTMARNALRGPDGSIYLKPADRLTASEEMFFCGSPLAHIVHYEHELERYRRRTFRHIAQVRRLHLWGAL
jgi:hypothetical protein